VKTFIRGATMTLFGTLLAAGASLGIADPPVPLPASPGNPRAISAFTNHAVFLQTTNGAAIRSWPTIRRRTAPSLPAAPTTRAGTAGWPPHRSLIPWLRKGHWSWPTAVTSFWP